MIPWGGTKTQEAIDISLKQILNSDIKGTVGIYIITDGCPDSSCAKMENAIARLQESLINHDLTIKIHAMDCASSNV